MPPSGMVLRVVLVRTDVSEARFDSIIRVTRIGELRTTLPVTSNRSIRRLLVTGNVVPSKPILVTLMMEAIRSSETSVLTRTTRRTIPEDGIFNCLFVCLFVCWFWVVRAVTHTVGRRLPNAATSIRSRIEPCGICGG
jgi:hypothetical protein